MDRSVRVYRLLILIAFLIVLTTVISTAESGTGDWAAITLFAVIMMVTGAGLCVYAVRSSPGQEPL